jgi:hypothetical protein
LLWLTAVAKATPPLKLPASKSVVLALPLKV